MTRKCAPGLVAVAVIGVLAPTAPATAGASTAVPSGTSVADRAVPWGPAQSGNSLARARGTLSIRTSNGDDTTAQVTFSLYDLDGTSTEAGGECAYVVFQALKGNARWSEVHQARHCGGSTPAADGFEVQGVKGVRVRVCQYDPDGESVGECGRWRTLYDIGSLDAVGMENEVVRLTNEARAAGGCRPLAPDTRLRFAAMRHAADMSAKNYFSHASPDDRGAANRMEEAGFSPLGPWGENIARGLPTPADVVKSWLDHPSDNANIMNCDLTHIGVGYAPAGDYWTLVLAAHR
ncbi:CAP domain-containing protein [Nonomuraea sp. bgisy101]|uniref:CAP domain-containing protein n=1 Tax=Nonomuraea sp. bgisy101 TaxID=3413784 RepID=UPI003D73254F